MPCYEANTYLASEAKKYSIPLSSAVQKFVLCESNSKVGRSSFVVSNRKNMKFQNFPLPRTQFTTKRFLTALNNQIVKLTQLKDFIFKDK